MTSSGCELKPARLRNGATLRALVRQFIDSRRTCGSDEMARFRKMDNFEACLKTAALSEMENGKMHRHQCRPGRVACHRASIALLEHSSILRGCRTFDELHDRVRETCLHLDRIGGLYYYDVAHRVGQYLQLEPRKIYLHRGTREGARRLGLDWHKNALEMCELPEELRDLTPAEVEDFLCICMDEFLGVRPSKQSE